MDSRLNWIAELFRYGQQMNLELLRVAGGLTAEQLDRPLDIGMGSVRRILAHVLHGEATWLARFTGHAEAPWPAAEPDISPEQIAARLAEVALQRSTFLDALDPARLSDRLAYRDSRGSQFTATLQQMLIQTVLHSHHHRAQIVNSIRRVGGHVVEVDYMYSVRQPMA